MMTKEELEWLQFKYAMNAALPDTSRQQSADLQWQYVWQVWSPKRPPTEEEKQVHHAISFDHGDGKRYGHRTYTGSDE